MPNSSDSYKKALREGYIRLFGRGGDGEFNSSYNFLKAALEKQLELLGGEVIVRIELSTHKKNTENAKINFLELDDRFEEGTIFANYIANIIVLESSVSQEDLGFLLSKARSLKYDNVMNVTLPSPPFRNEVTLKDLYLWYKSNGYVQEELHAFLYLWSIK